MFKNATYYISPDELEFWTQKPGKEETFPNFMLGIGNAQLEPVRELIKPYKDGDEIVPGITAIAAPGHTIGHHAFMLHDGDSKLLHLMDAAVHYLVGPEEPDWALAVEMDQNAAAETRRRLFKQAAEEKLLVAGYHFPFPGTGPDHKTGNGLAICSNADRLNWNAVKELTMQKKIIIVLTLMLVGRAMTLAFIHRAGGLNPGDPPAAWLMPLVGDALIGISGLAIAYLIVSRTGLFVWTAVIVWNSLAIWDAMSAFIIHLTNPWPDFFMIQIFGPVMFFAASAMHLVILYLAIQPRQRAELMGDNANQRIMIGDQ